MHGYCSRPQAPHGDVQAKARERVICRAAIVAIEGHGELNPSYCSCSAAVCMPFRMKNRAKDACMLFAGACATSYRDARIIMITDLVSEMQEQQDCDSLKVCLRGSG